jgi:hypothetical protein
VVVDEATFRIGIVFTRIIDHAHVTFCRRGGVGQDAVQFPHLKVVAALVRHAYGEGGAFVILWYGVSIQKALDFHLRRRLCSERELLPIDCVYW